MNPTANPIYLGVNVDHVATLRQARKTRYPDPIQAVIASENAGADGITVHLREDRRHINERDVRMINNMLLTRLNLEMAITEQMLLFAEEIKPVYCCLVPEKREELTTEGGLDLLLEPQKIKDACSRLADSHILTSLFIDPDFAQIDAACASGAPVIEIHTGQYTEASSAFEREKELQRIISAVGYAASLGLVVNAGHGLNYQNVAAIAQIPQIHELNIGHAIVSQALFVGFEPAVREMKRLMVMARGGYL